MATEQIETVIDLSDKGSPQGDEQNQNQGKQVAGDGSGDDLIVEQIDDRPEQDRNRTPPKGYTPRGRPTEKELSKYTEGVQERMRQMNWEYHEVRRQNEEWQRENAAAIDLAKRMHAENLQMRRLMAQGHQTLLQTQKAGAEGEMKALQESFKAALDSGDTAKAAELQGKIAQAAARGEAVNYVQPIFPEHSQQAPQGQWNGQQPPQQGWQPQPQHQPQQTPQLSQEARQWLNDNPWYNGATQREQEMTAVAMAADNWMQRQGVPVGSPQYWSTIDRTVRERFPDYTGFQSGNGGTNQPQRRAPVGAPTRTNNNGSSQTRVGLTLSEMRVADKMKISHADYAREKLRLAQEDQNNG